MLGELLLMMGTLCLHRSWGQDLGSSPLKVAQCRANCLQSFMGGTASKNCFQNSKCNTCWEQCRLLEAGWSSVCDDDINCVDGCREACRFHLQLEVQRSPVLVTRGQEVILLTKDSASWPAATASGSPHVFVLMCRRQDHSWTQVAQTLELSWRIPRTLRCQTVRVMVVGVDGLVTVYSPVSRALQDADLIIRSLGKDSWAQPRDYPNLNSSADDSNKVFGWHIREVSLIHQGVLVIAEVAWEAQGSAAVYLVTWELDGGGLKGNLLTDSTCVTLSLWPDTVYHIQVQVVQEPSKLSELLVLDTRLATPVHTTVTQPVLGHPGFEAVAGAATAVMLFLILALILSGRAKSLVDKKSIIDELKTSDHFKLFPPPVRLLLETPAPSTFIPVVPAAPVIPVGADLSSPTGDVA